MKTSHSSPPRLFFQFFRWFCRPDLMKYIEGDLIELYEERCEVEGVKKANIQFMIESENLSQTIAAFASIYAYAFYLYSNRCPIELFYK